MRRRGLSFEAKGASGPLMARCAFLRNNRASVTMSRLLLVTRTILAPLSIEYCSRATSKMHPTFPFDLNSMNFLAILHRTGETYLAVYVTPFPSITRLFTLDTSSHQAIIPVV